MKKKDLDLEADRRRYEELLKMDLPVIPRVRPWRGQVEENPGMKRPKYHPQPKQKAPPKERKCIKHKANTYEEMVMASHTYEQMVGMAAASLGDRKADNGDIDPVLAHGFVRKNAVWENERFSVDEYSGPYDPMPPVPLI